MLNGSWQVLEEKTDWRGIVLLRARRDGSGEECLLEDLAMATTVKERFLLEVVRGLEGVIEQARAVAHPALRQPRDVTRHADRHFLVRPFEEALWRSWGAKPAPCDPAELGAWLRTMAEVQAAYHDAGMITHGIARTDLVPAETGVLICEPMSQAYLAAYRERDQNQRHEMAPEVAKNAPWGRPADMFTLGLNAYLLATGRFPLSGNGGVLADNLLAETIADPRAFAPALGGELARTIMSLLDRKPAKRPAAAVLAETLAAQGRDGRWAAGPEAQEEYGRTGRRQAELLARREHWRGLMRRNRGRILIGAGVLIGLVLLTSLRGRPPVPVITSATAPAQVVAAFYRAIDTLDQTLLEETLAAKVGKDVRQMVMTIFVMHRVNIADGGGSINAASPLRVRELAVAGLRRDPPAFRARYDLAMRKGVGDQTVDEIMIMEDQLTLGRVKNKRVGEKWVITGLVRKQVGARTVKVPVEERSVRQTAPPMGL